MTSIDQSPVVNDEQDTATNTESEDNPVFTNSKGNITFLILVHLTIIYHTMMLSAEVRYMGMLPWECLKCTSWCKRH